MKSAKNLSYDTHDNNSIGYKVKQRKAQYEGPVPFVITDHSKGSKPRQRLMEPKLQKLVILLIYLSQDHPGQLIRVPLGTIKSIRGDRGHYSKADYYDLLEAELILLEMGFRAVDEELNESLRFFSATPVIDRFSGELLCSVNQEFLKCYFRREPIISVRTLKEFNSLNGKYSFSMYRLLAQGESNGYLRIPMWELMRQMCIRNTCYESETRDITRRIIKPSLAEIRIKIPMFANVRFEYFKKYKPSSVLFHWTPRKTNRENIIASSQISSNTYIPNSDEVTRYVAKIGITDFSKVKTFILWCNITLKKFGTWDALGCPNGWEDFLQVFLENDDDLSWMIAFVS